MSNKARYIGRVVVVNPTEKLGKDPNKPFYKRTIVVDDADAGSKYPNTCEFEYTGDKCKYLDGFNVGDLVTVDYYPNGRSWNDPKTHKTRYFNSLRIAYIQKGAVEDGDAGAADAGADETGADAQGEDGIADDMPF